MSRYAVDSGRRVRTHCAAGPVPTGSLIRDWPLGTGPQMFVSEDAFLAEREERQNAGDADDHVDNS